MKKVLALLFAASMLSACQPQYWPTVQPDARPAPVILDREGNLVETPDLDEDDQVSAHTP